MTVDGPAVATGAAAAMVAAVPAVAIGAAVVDEGSAAVYLIALVAAVAYAAGGFVAARRVRTSTIANGALAALAAYVISQAIAVIVNLAGDDDTNVVAVLVTAIPAVGFGMLGAAATERFGPARLS